MQKSLLGKNRAEEDFLSIYFRITQFQKLTEFQKIAWETDWETLPLHLQDAVDALLMEEADEENGEIRPLRDFLRETGEAP